MPFRAQLSSASRRRTASSDGASITCRISRSPSSGPPRTTKPSSTSESMKVACSSQPSCPRRSRAQSHGPPRCRRTAKNTERSLGPRFTRAACRTAGLSSQTASIRTTDLGRWASGHEPLAVFHRPTPTATRREGPGAVVSRRFGPRRRRRSGGRLCPTGVAGSGAGDVGIVTASHPGRRPRHR